MNYRTLKSNILKALAKHSEKYKLVSTKISLKDSEITLCIIRKLHKYNIIETYEQNYSMLWKINDTIDDKIVGILIEICEEHI